LTFSKGFYENGSEVRLHGIYNLEDLKGFGEEHVMCPYYLARHSINFADVIIYSYQYIVNPRIAERISAQFEGNAIVVFDEAHNIDDVCIESLSVEFDKKTVESAGKNLTTLNRRLLEVKKKDAQKLQQEYTRLMEGLKNTFFLPFLSFLGLTANPVTTLTQEPIHTQPSKIFFDF